MTRWIRWSMMLTAFAAAFGAGMVNAGQPLSPSATSPPASEATTPATLMPSALRPVVEQPLWPGAAPGSEDWVDSQKTDARGIITGRFQPTVAFFPADQSRATGQAMVLCPGGGYWAVAYDHEGMQIARTLQDSGVSVLLLKYRVRTDPKETNVEALALADATRAVRILRANAGQMRVDPNQIGIGGFSAGGHLAMNVALHPTPGNESSPDPVDRVGSDVAFLALIYPYLSGLVDQVTPQTPSAFISVSADDDLSHFSHALHRKLLETGVNSELHVFPTGGHGYGPGVEGSAESQWPSLLKTWLRLRNYETPTVPRDPQSR